MDSGYGSHSGLCRDSWFRVNADSCRRVVCTRNAAPFAPPVDFNASAGNAPGMPPDTGFRIDHTTITLALERRSTLSFILYESWDLPYAQATVTGRHFNSCHIHAKTVLKLTGFRKWLVELKKKKKNSRLRVGDKFSCRNCVCVISGNNDGENLC